MAKKETQQTKQTTPDRTPNDQRSDVKNPNNEEYKKAQDNRSRQLNREPDPSDESASPEGEER